MKEMPGSEEVEKDSIIKEIVAQSTVVVENESESVKSNLINLKYGNKAMRLEIVYITDPDGTVVISAGTRVENIFNDEVYKKIDETSLLYTAAKNILQREANQNNIEIKYSLITQNINMAIWAAEKGSTIFEWSELPPGLDIESLKSKQKAELTELDKKLTFRKKFLPETNE